MLWHAIISPFYCLRGLDMFGRISAIDTYIFISLTFMTCLCLWLYAPQSLLKIKASLTLHATLPLRPTGQGLLSLQQVREKGECCYFFCFFTFINFPLSLLLFHLLYYFLISFIPFSGRRHQMTHKGWRVVKPQHNQSIPHHCRVTKHVEKMAVFDV